MDLSLSRSTSLSEEDHLLPVENVEFSMSLNDMNDHEDERQVVSKPRPFAAMAVTAATRYNNSINTRIRHVRQQSGGSSVGSVDPIETDVEATMPPILSAEAAHQLYWQQWQQYYAMYGYPQYSSSPPSADGRDHQLHLQQQSPQQMGYHQQQYDTLEHHNRASDDAMGSTLPPYTNMYPAAATQSPHPQQLHYSQQQQQRQQGLVSQQQHSPSWPTNYTQSKPPSTPAHSSFPVQHRRSSSNPGISSGGGGGGGGTYQNNRSSVGISARTDRTDEASPLQLSTTPKSSNYGTALSGNSNSSSRSPKVVRHYHHLNRSHSLGRDHVDDARRQHHRSHSDFHTTTSRSGGGGSGSNNATAASRNGSALSLPRPVDPMRLSSSGGSKKRLDQTLPPPLSRTAPGSGRHHRRGSSMASSGGLSVSSMVSVVSDIRKSGTYKMHYGRMDGTRIDNVNDALSKQVAHVYLFPVHSVLQYQN
jgi:hypothetical protein